MEIQTLFFIIVLITSSINGENFKARYDNFRLMRLSMQTQKQVDIFREIRTESDCYDTYIVHGKIFEAPQEMMILIPSHK